MNTEQKNRIIRALVQLPYLEHGLVEGDVTLLISLVKGE